MNGGFLVTKIKQLGDRIFEKILREKNIDSFNGAQGRILYVLWQEDGISIRSLSTKCGLAITSLTTMLERMENQGLISRVQSETDKRKTLMFLTEKAHACKYCYASFMKRFTGHKEEWGTFLDVKHWPEIKNPKKYDGQRVVIGSVTDGYNPQEEQFGNTRKLLEQLIGSDADILICTKSDLVVRDIDLLKKLGRVTVSWSINTLDENFKNDMDSASSIERRIAAMKQVYEAGIRTVCFVSPVFPGITDFEAIFERVKDQCDLFWLENLNLRGGFKKTIMEYIAVKHPDLVPLYDEIYNKHNRSYFEALEVKAEKMAKKYDCAFVDNEMPYGRVPQGHPVIVDYFYHEEIRGTDNSGKRNR